MTLKSLEQRCSVHDKMVHKTELHWILAIFFAFISGLCGAIYANSATKDQVEGLQRQIDRTEKSFERFDNKLDEIHRLVLRNQP